MTSNNNDIMNRLGNMDYPDFDDPDFVNNLKSAANVFQNKKTVEGYLSSVLIYHQIAEEMARILVEYSDFVVDCSVYPTTFSRKKREDKPFGYLINDLENTMVFEERKHFAEKCREYNSIRNDLVHRIIKRKISLSKTKKDAIMAKKIFEDIEKCFNQSVNVYKDILSKHFEDYFLSAEDIIGGRK